jgi:hypothetical protein
VTHAGITKPTTATRAFDNGSFATQGTAANLFPFVVPYSFYAGTCIGNAPTTWLPSATMASAAVAAGSTTTTVPVRVPTVAVQVLKADGTPATDVPISIRPATPATTYPKMAGCTERIPLATGTGSGAVRTAPAKPGTTPATDPYRGFASVHLPYGQWLVCADNGNNRRQTVVLNNTPQGTTPAADAPSQGAPSATVQAMTGVPNVPSVKITLPATNNGNPAC